MGSAFHQLCPRYSGTLAPTAPTAIRLWETFTFTYKTKTVGCIIMGGGGSGGAKVLGKPSVPGRPTSLDDSRARAYCACSRSGWGCLDIFLSSIFSLFFLPLSGRRPDID